MGQFYLHPAYDYCDRVKGWIAASSRSEIGFRYHPQLEDKVEIVALDSAEIVSVPIRPCSSCHKVYTRPGVARCRACQRIETRRLAAQKAQRRHGLLRRTCLVCGDPFFYQPAGWIKPPRYCSGCRLAAEELKQRADPREDKHAPEVVIRTGTPTPFSWGRCATCHDPIVPPRTVVGDRTFCTRACYDAFTGDLYD